MLLAESQRKTVEHLEGGHPREAAGPGRAIGSTQGAGRRAARRDPDARADWRSSSGSAGRSAFDIWRLEAEEAGDAALDPAAAPEAPAAARAARSPAQTALFEARQRAHAARSASLRREIDQLSAQIVASDGAGAGAAERQLARWTEERVAER